MKEYNVVLPIAGHAYLTVEAESPEDAIEKALDIVMIDNVEDWTALEHCPYPWEAQAEPVDDDDRKNEDDISKRWPMQFPKDDP